MKIVLFAAALTLSVPTFANPKPGGERPGTRPEGRVNRSLEVMSRFNRTATEVFGTEVNIRLPETLTAEKATQLAQRFESLDSTLTAKQGEIRQDTTKRTELAAIVEAINPALSGRSRFVDFLDSAQQGRVEASDAIKTAAQDIVDLVDNMATIISAKVNDSAEAPVSTAQILRVLNVLGSNNRAQLSADDIVRFETSIKDIFGNEYSIRQVARCR